MNERLTELLQTVAKAYADDQLRNTYTVTDTPGLLRLTGVAAGVESFVSLITEAPRAARNDQTTASLRI